MSRLFNSICIIFARHTSLVESVLPYILAKTQHRYHAIRSRALECIIDLVRDDYLKLRGSILIYMLAALVDPHAATAERAYELLLKYNAERNEILLRSCLLECPFVLNSYSYHENLDMFGGGSASATDVNLPASLLGHTNRTNRQRIYRFFVMRIEAVHCYMFFENFHMINDKLAHDPLIRSAEGLAAVHDILFILTEICRAKERRGRAGGVRQGADGESEDDDNAEQTQAATPATVGGVGKGRGGAAAKRGPTIEQALLVVEKVIPTIATVDGRLRSIDDAGFGSVMDAFCTAICEHFPSLTELAVPAKFWAKYRRQRPRPPPKPKPKRTDPDGSDDDELQQPPRTDVKNKSKLNEDDDDDDEGGGGQKDSKRPPAVELRRTPSRKVDRRSSGRSTKATTIAPTDIVQSESESDNDREHRKVRLSRKRMNK